MKFRPYEKELDSFIEQYVLTDDQLLYTASPREALKDMNEQRYPILAFNEEEELVSFFVLELGEAPQKFLGNEKSILFRSFSTDARYMGKGFGKSILKKMPEYIRQHYPQTKEIVLAVNEDNTQAQKLYFNTGYVDNGKRMMGHRAPLIILEYSLG